MLHVTIRLIIYTRNYSHGLGHRYVTREKGGCEREGYARQETVELVDILLSLR